MFNFEIVNQENRYKFIGVISETSDFSPILENDFEVIYVDLVGVERINSVGVREWVESFRKSNKKYIFHNIPAFIMEQFNMVPGLIPPGSIIDSFYGNYYCDYCGNETSHRFKIGLNFKPDDREFPETIECIHCGEEAEADFDEAFFSIFNYGF